jgi:hypothetical protein
MSAFKKTQENVNSHRMTGPDDYEARFDEERVIYGSKVYGVAPAKKVGELYFSTDPLFYRFAFAFDGQIPESLIPGYIGGLPEQLVEGFNDLEKPWGCDRLGIRRIKSIVNYQGSVLVNVEQV